MVDNDEVHITSRVDYAVRALVVLAAAQERGEDRLTTESIAHDQNIPSRFLEGIMRDLRMAGFVSSRRGVDGGYRLGRAASSIKIADIIRTVDGPLAEVRGQRPEDWEYPGCAADLREVWVAARASLRSVLENVSLADIASAHLPDEVRSWTKDPDVWLAH